MSLFLRLGHRNCIDWAATNVSVMKRDGSSVRICGDCLKSDLFSTLSSGNVFTKLDLRQAYQQLELDENSKQYVVINTHRGLFQYNRLHFGV